MTIQAAFDKQLNALGDKAGDEFSRWCVVGAKHALIDETNPLRLNFFATAMRTLFEHTMGVRSPEDQVRGCSWFKSEREGGKPTRWQRVIFAIQGGLDENFVVSELKVDIAPLRKRLIDAVDELSKHVHGRENTIIRNPGEQAIVVERTLSAMTAFLDAMHECRDAVLAPISEAIDEAAIDALLTETIQSVDELATHYFLEEVYNDSITVHAITADTITYRVTGSVGVILQWGSNSDVRRGDGAQISKSFPFVCEFELPLDDPWDLRLAEPTFTVDTQEWRDLMRPDERDYQP